MSKKQWDICVIGAGPAGLEAALSASDCGLEVLLVDEHAGLGGNIYKGLEGPFAVKYMEPDVYQQGKDLAERFLHSGISYMKRTTVWHASPDFIIVSHKGVSQKILCRSLIIANGAAERPVPFSGWTLPGVMGLGGFDLLSKSSGYSPDSPVTLLGNGPLILQTAYKLLSAGNEIQAIIDTGNLSARIKGIIKMPPAVFDLPYLGKGLRMLLTIAKKRVPLIKAQRVQAHGDNSLESLTINTGKKTHVLPTKSLLVHEGFIPRTHFSHQLRCQHRWDKKGRYWKPSCTNTGKSVNTPNVFFVGDGHSVDGAEAAHLKGTIAGLAAAHNLGFISDFEFKERATKSKRDLTKILVTRAYIHSFFAPSPHLYNLVDDVILCRCEHVTVGQIKQSILEGCVDINDIKTRTRAGMGQCQSRMCQTSVAEVAALAMGTRPELMGELSIRSPIRPISMQEVCDFTNENHS